MNTQIKINFYPLYEYISDKWFVFKVDTQEKIFCNYYWCKIFFNPYKTRGYKFLINYAFLWLKILKTKISYKKKKSKIKHLSKKSKKINLYFILYSFFFKNDFIRFYVFNRTLKKISHIFTDFFEIYINLKKNSITALKFKKKIFGDGFLHIRGLVIIFFLDSLITDDEPLWEPLEWSLVQTWILFIFIFAWIAENLITSRYGSFTGRDKRVWLGWYKTFWLLEIWYALSYGAAALFVIVPFYYEISYNVAFIFSWWNWYSKLFFFKFISTYSIVLLISYWLQLNLRWLNWKKLLISVIIINLFIAYLVYTHFIMTFFGYFTDPIWFQKTRLIDLVQLSHEPLKWGWGNAKRDHFPHHKTTTVFWFKNDGPFASAFLIIHMFFFLSIFFLYFYWLVLLRRLYTTQELTYTFLTYCVSALKQFFYFFFTFYILILMSFIMSYWRFPIEFIWVLNQHSWFVHFIFILKDYFFF